MPFAVYQLQQPQQFRKRRSHPFASLPKHLEHSCNAAKFCISCTLCAPPARVLSKLRREIGLVKHLPCITLAAITQQWAQQTLLAQLHLLCRGKKGSSVQACSHLKPVQAFDQGHEWCQRQDCKHTCCCFKRAWLKGVPIHFKIHFFKHCLVQIILLFAQLTPNPHMDSSRFQTKAKTQDATNKLYSKRVNRRYFPSVKVCVVYAGNASVATDSSGEIPEKHKRAATFQIWSIPLKLSANNRPLFRETIERWRQASNLRHSWRSVDVNSQFKVGLCKKKIPPLFYSKSLRVSEQFSLPWKLKF